MWVLFSFFSKPNVSRDNIYRSGTRLRASSNEKFFLVNLKRKIYARIHFQWLWITFLDLNLSQTIIEARVVYMQKKNAKKSSHPNKSSNPTCLLSDSNVSKPKPRSPIPQPASTCLDASNHQSKNSKIPQSSRFQTDSNSLSLSLHPNLPQRPTQHLPLQKKLPRPVEINDAPESFSQTCSN